ncbi:Protein of unknown function [Pyronema omphalodes CBS 100304]|uniref:Uncharacterized protein n=1 Tax=Pyronema omphalodes (strain CBS 100304) TaxID=1076935 RepID=U4LG13_PYROM|nr:Protein of unknown function [Pyronema omphalodes CBS 100304]
MSLSIAMSVTLPKITCQRRNKTKMMCYFWPVIPNDCCGIRGAIACDHLERCMRMCTLGGGLSIDMHK